MAENTPSAMDFAEHERTYAGFINFSKVGTVAVLNVVLCLIMTTFGGGAGTFFGTIGILATLVTGAIGLAAGEKGWIPPAVVFVIAGLLAVVTTA